MMRRVVVHTRFEKVYDKREEKEAQWMTSWQSFAPLRRSQGINLRREWSTSASPEHSILQPRNLFSAFVHLSPTRSATNGRTPATASLGSPIIDRITQRRLNNSDAGVGEKLRGVRTRIGNVRNKRLWREKVDETSRYLKNDE